VNRVRRLVPACLATAFALASALPAAAFDWTPYREDSTIEILTFDEDGSLRETKIWIVVLDDAGYVRTNDSRWLANIRRDPAVRLRTRGVESWFTAEETDDADVYDAVEEAFKQKYGWMQRTMSVFRMSRPTVLRLTPRSDP